MIVPVQLDETTGDYFIEFPPALLARLGWKENDTLIWEDAGDGSFVIKRKPSED